jgi:hypothetical protein
MIYIWERHRTFGSVCCDDYLHFIVFRCIERIHLIFERDFRMDRAAGVPNACHMKVVDAFCDRNNLIHAYVIKEMG